VKRHDLDEDGNAIRRLAYTGGQLARREYHTARGEHITTEVFDADGFITESMRNRKRQAWAHWWFVKGSPVKHWSARGGHHSASTERGGTYMKQGIRWVKVADGKP
ncbi:MAG: hypothetical protein HON70_24985, partial [Lentisphaerae bacterium]|nr:hypothetical protein [Lentisphaerota bacterium]